MCLTPGAACRLLAGVMRSLMPEGNGKKRKQKRRELYQMCLTPGAVCRLLAGGDAEFDARGKWLVLEEWTETFHLPWQWCLCRYSFVLLDLLSQLWGGEAVLEHFPASEVTTKLGINPFAAPACKISRLKSAHTHTQLQTVYFLVLHTTNQLPILISFNKKLNPFAC